MNVFLSCVSTEFKSYRLRLANQLGALKDHPYEIKVQEDFQQGGYTLLDKLADYIRECDLVIHLAGDACGARLTAEHVQALYRSLGDAPPDPLPDWSYTQWEYRLALRFQRKMLVYLATAEAPRDCPLPVQQSDDVARSQQVHIAAIKAGGKHYGTFTGYNSLLREVFHDLGLEPDLKINNLPLKSLGSLFKGREEFLRRMHAALGRVEHRGHQRFAAITASATAATVYGLGGIGKTRAAIEYAHRYAEEYTALLLVRADTPDGLQQNLAALCGHEMLDLPEKAAREIEVQVAAVLQWLQRHAGWLLIFDNADTDDAAQAVQELLGRLTPAGQVLVTSRLSNWPGAVESLALDVLEEADATAFLLERTEARRRKAPDDAAQAPALALELGRLALALEQAGAYIERYRCTFTTFFAEWQQRREKVLPWFDPRVMQYPMSVAVTWQTSFDRLNEGPRELLRLLAWFAPDPIPESLLEAGGVPFAEEGAERMAALTDAREALADLEAQSLVTRAEHSASFAVHRLVQEVTRQSLGGDREHTYLKAALAWVDAAYVGDPQDVRTWPVLAPLAAHALVLTRHADAAQISEPTAGLMNRLGQLYHARAQYVEAEPLYRRALSIDEKAYGPNDATVAIRLNSVATLLHATHRLEEAERLMKRVVEIFEKAYGSEDAKVATALSNLAQLLPTNRLDEAEPLMQRALAIDEKYGPDSPAVARDLNNLAQLLQATNRLGEAEPLMRRALAIDEKFYGPDHPAVARDLDNLAALLQATNRPGEAEPLMWQALAIDEKYYGPEHPNVAIALSNLVALRWAMNRPGEAEPLMRRALAIDEKAYRPDHPQVAKDLNNLALLLKDMNRLGEAEPLMRQVVDMFEKAYWSEDPNVATALNNLARLLQATNRLGEAEPLMRRALAIDEKAYGPDHPAVARDLNNLALLLRDTNRLEEAEPLTQRHLEIFFKFRRDTGHEHPHLIAAIGNYANLLQQMGYSEKQVGGRLQEIAAKYGFLIGQK
jgi:tetratricopeptide (TPR) repeat protein